uniref:L antigen family member 3 n=1 Tax=Podarcis muralis TaxID=64176 RepID=A0A670KIE0_PODMU
GGGRGQRRDRGARGGDQAPGCLGAASSCLEEAGGAKALEMGFPGCTSKGELSSCPNTRLCGIPFPSSSLAQIALGSLAPDPEPRKEGISKELDVTEDILHVRWRADEARILRVSISSFLEHLCLVVETMDLFGPPVA